MSNLSTVRTGNGSSALTRPFADLWNFDPFRALGSAMSGVEISRGENGYVVELPVPGFSQENIEITLQDGVLLVTGKTEKRNFTRSIVLPEEVDTENIEATVEHGLLTLNLHFVPKAQPKRISVKGQG